MSKTKKTDSAKTPLDAIDWRLPGKEDGAWQIATRMVEIDKQHRPDRLENVPEPVLAVYQHMQETAEKDFEKKGISKQEKYFASISTMEILVNLGSEFIYALTHDEPGCEKFMASREVRARATAYFFNVMLRNCNGTNMACAEDIMERCGGFDYQSEIKSDEKWLVPLTGSLYNDIRTNFVAKFVHKESDANVAIDLIVELIKHINGQADRHFAFGMGTMFVAPVIPNADEDHLDAFFSACIHKNGNGKRPSDTDVAQRELETASKKHVLRRFVHKDVNWCKGLLLDNAIFQNSADGSLCFVPNTDDGINTCMGNPDRTNTGVRFYGCLTGPDRSSVESLCDLREVLHRERGKKNPDSALLTNALTKLKEEYQHEHLKRTTPDVTRAKVSYQHLLGQMVDRERLEFQLARKEAYQQEKKTAKAANTTKHEASKLQAVEKDLHAYQQERDRARAELSEVKTALQARTQKMQAQAERIKKLENQQNVLQNQVGRADGEKKELLARIAELERANHKLELTIASMSGAKHTQMEPAESQMLDTGVFDFLNIVCVGGHTSWANAMKDLHDNVSIYPADGPACPPEVIIGCDALWIQTNSISHPAYYKAEDTAKQYNIPVRYFKYAGHRQCKKQLVAETKSMFSPTASINETAT